jgi:hypothetical protein
MAVGKHRPVREEVSGQKEKYENLKHDNSKKV